MRRFFGLALIQQETVSDGHLIIDLPVCYWLRQPNDEIFDLDLLARAPAEVISEGGK